MSAEIYTAAGQINLWKKDREQREKEGFLEGLSSSRWWRTKQLSALCRMNSCDVR